MWFVLLLLLLILTPTDGLFRLARTGGERFELARERIGYLNLKCYHNCATKDEKRLCIRNCVETIYDQIEDTKNKRWRRKDDDDD